ncbi:MAG: hypothetical protein IKE30_06255 [Clostridia bacterium]|nr:hypothetical protein [Clostridia bacterium]
MKIRKAGRLLLALLILCLSLSGCRTRVVENGRAPGNREAAAAGRESRGGKPADDGAQEAETGEETGEEAGGRTRENPEAARKEYDEKAPAEMVSGTERTVHGEGEGSGASVEREDADEAVARLRETAQEDITQTVAADRAEKMGVSEDAREADSAMTYFTLLLQDRMGSLFECQRRYVYWETAEDHVTVFKTSAEHSLILNAGAYDVSARLLPENLRVDDGWVARKNPGVIVKAVGRSVLGTGVSSVSAAKKVYGGLLGRNGWEAVDAVQNGRVLLLSEELLETPHLQVAAMLMVAKTSNPELFADVDTAKALEMLSEEATGSIPAGIYCYDGRGGA